MHRLQKPLRKNRRFSIENNVADASPAGGGIDSIDQVKKRRVPRGQVRSLDDEIPDRKRKQITLSGRSITTNFEIAAWAIRKHLDFVSRFSFASKTGIKAFDDDVEGFVKWWSRPLNFDIAGKHGLHESIRLIEALACVDGDGHFLKIETGHIQGIEGDLIATPEERKGEAGKFDRERTYNGVECSSNGRPLRYAIHSRNRHGGLKFERWVRNENIFNHGFFDRWDQVRGVSPVVAAIGRFQDVYEGFDYSLQRLKLAQLFGIAITRSTSDNGFGKPEGTDEDGDGKNDHYDVKVGSQPIVLDMDPGDDLKFVENKTPAPETQDFLNLMIGAALKSLDIPFSFYDESYTNFFGSKAALTLYLLSVRRKRERIQELLRQMTIWRLKLAIADDVITLPREIKTLDQLVFKWNPIGIPWFDPRDIRGDIDAMKAGLTTRQQICMDRLGMDWADDIAPQLASEEKLIEELGLNVTMDVSAASIKDDEEIEDVETSNGGVKR